MAAPDEYPELSLRQLADRVAARTPAPGGGSVAALVLTLAAGLVTMAARFSDGHWEGAAAVAERSERLRAEVTPLAGEDAAAYAAVLEAGRAPATSEDARRGRVEEARRSAAGIPLQIGQLAAEVAELGAAVAVNGNPNLEGDAAAGALLAASAARIAANLVEINLDGAAGDPRLERARALAESAEAAARSATRRS